MAKHGGGGGGGGGGGKGGSKPTAEQISGLFAIPVLGPILETLFKDFKSVLQIDLSTVLSWMDDEIHAKAVELGSAASKKVKRDSFFRNWFMQRFSSVAINQLEKYGTDQTGWSKGAIAKLADFLDSFRQAFFGSAHEAERFEEETLRLNPELQKVFADFDRQFMTLTAQTVLNEPDSAKRAELGKQTLDTYAQTIAPLKHLMATGKVPGAEKKEEAPPERQKFGEWLTETAGTVDGVCNTYGAPVVRTWQASQQARWQALSEKKARAAATRPPDPPLARWIKRVQKKLSGT